MKKPTDSDQELYREMHMPMFNIALRTMRNRSARAATGTVGCVETARLIKQ